MPFQREDITLQERMRIVASIIDQPGRYGVISQLAREYRLSRQTLYTLLQRGQEALAQGLEARTVGRPAAATSLTVDKNRLDRAIVALTVGGHASLEGVQGCLAEVFDVDRSIGYLSGVLDRAGLAAHAWLEQVCPPNPIRADLDEIFSGRTPHLAMIDHDSTLILALQRAQARDSTTWGVLLLDQQAKGVQVAEAASDGALGIRSGLAESGVGAAHLGDLFHVVRALMVVGGHLEKAAYAAIGCEEQARLAEAEAHAVHPRRGPKRRSGCSLAEASAASQQAIQRCDEYAWLVGVVRETLAPVDARTGALHRASTSRQELLAVVSLLCEQADARVTKVAGRLERAIDSLVRYQERLAEALAPWTAALGQETVALIGWGWRHRHGLGLTTVAEAVAAFPAAHGEGVRAVWTALDGAHRGSSLVECVNSLLRPHLLVHRGADQGLLDLLACSLDHRVFSRGKRRGQSPLQLAGLPDSGDWLVTIGFAPKRQPSQPHTSKQAGDSPQAQPVNRFAA